MANTPFPKGAQKILSGAINLVTDTIKATLLPDTYTFSTSHEFLSQLGARIGTDQTLAGKSVAGGAFDADDLDFGPLAPGANVKSLALYKDTGNPSTSPLVYFADVVAGLPMTTNGGGITIPWDDGPRKIFRIGAPVYAPAANALLTGGINLATANLKVALLPNSYAFDPAHATLADVGTTIGTPQALLNVSVAGGVFDADDVDFGAIAAGATSGSAVVFIDGGSPAASPLVLHRPSVVGLPYIHNGAGVGLRWPNGASKIFSIVA